MLRLGRCCSFLVYAFLICKFFIPLSAQQDSVSYRAKKLEMMVIDGVTCKKLKGDVVFTFKPSGIVLTADEACKYDEKNLIQAFGHVEIVDKEVGTIQADTLAYDLEKGIATLEGNIICKSETYTFFASKLIYHVKKKQGNFLNHGKLMQGEMILTSQSGMYDGAKQFVSFSKEVVLKDPSHELHCDELLYDTKTEKATFSGNTKIAFQEVVLTTQKGGTYFLKSKNLLFEKGTLNRKDMMLQADLLEISDLQDCKATGHVSVEAKAYRAIITGEKAIYSKKEEKMEITGRPLLIKELDDDKVYIRADTFIALQKTQEDGTVAQEIHALNNLKLYANKIQGIADGAVYHSVKKVIELHNKPVIWCNEYQITGEDCFLSIEEEKQMKLCIHKNLFFAFVDSVGNYNQIKSNKMVAEFKENKLDKMHIEGSSESLYFMLDQDSELVGMNYIKCNDIELMMQNNALDCITFKPKPTGNFYPAHELSLEQMTLTDFVWYGDKHPTLENILEFSTPVV